MPTLTLHVDEDVLHRAKRLASARQMTVEEMVGRLLRVMAQPATSDLEDAIQAAAALSIGADYVVTRNAKDFRFPGVNAVTADEFLALIPP